MMYIAAAPFKKIKKNLFFRHTEHNIIQLHYLHFTLREVTNNLLKLP